VLRRIFFFKYPIGSLWDYTDHFGHLKLEKISIPLTTISGERVNVVGRVKVNVSHASKKLLLYLLIVVDSGIIF
jgi:hypothetical protein